MIEDKVQVRALVSQDALGHLNPRRPQPRETRAGVSGIRVRRPDDHPREAGLDDRLAAGARASVGRTRLHGHIQNRRGLGPPAEASERYPLGVGLAIARMESFRDDNAVLNNQGYDHRIGMRLAPGLLRQGQRAPHMRFVINRGHGDWWLSPDRP